MADMNEYSDNYHAGMEQSEWQADNSTEMVQDAEGQIVQDENVAYYEGENEDYGCVELNSGEYTESNQYDACAEVNTEQDETYEGNEQTFGDGVGQHKDENIVDKEYFQHSGNVNEEKTDYLQHAKSEFNKNRQILLCNLPEVTETDVLNFLKGCDISDVAIEPELCQATVTLQTGEEAETIVEHFSGSSLLETPVDVTLRPLESMMCVTHLPFSLSEKEFRMHMEGYGTLVKCFLMRYEASGKSMGYGYVEFTHDKEKASEACEKINGLGMGSCIIECHFLPSAIVHFEDLLSKVVLVDHLPVNYTKEQEFETVISQMAEPVWCKLGIKSGQPLGFGLVEYITAEDGAKAQQKINGHTLQGHCIRASFCTPGISVEQTYSEIAQIRLSRMLPHRPPPPPLMPADGKLQPPPLISVESLTSPMIKKLLQDAPQALENFGSVLNQLQMHMVSQQQQRLDPRPGLLGEAPTLPAGPIMNPNLQVSLLAVLMAHQVQELCPDLMNKPSAQQFILSQISQPMGDRPSLLGNPLIAQANGMLKNLMESNAPKKLSAAALAAKKSLEDNQESAEHEAMEASDAQAEEKPAGEESSKTVGKFDSTFNFFGQKNVKISCDTLKTFTCLVQALSTEKPDAETPAPQPAGEEESTEGGSPFFNMPGVGLANTFLASFLETQIRQHLNALQLGMVTSALQAQTQQLQKNGEETGTAEQAAGNADKSKVAEKPVSLLDLPLLPPPGAAYNSGAGLLGPASRFGNRQNFSGPEKRSFQYDSGNGTNYGNYYNNQSNYGYGSDDSSYAYNYDPSYSDYYSQQGNAYGDAWNNYNAGEAWNSGQRPPKQAKTQNLMDLNAQQPAAAAKGTGQEWGADDPNYMYNYHMWNYYNNMYQQGTSNPGYDYYNSQNYGNQTGYENYSQYYTGIANVKQDAAPLPTGKPPSPPPIPGSETDVYSNIGGKTRSLFSPTISKPPSIRKSSVSSGSSYQNTSYASTPVSQQRKPHFIPSPEPSPEGFYVGQHSQGLGGHYYDSHFKKKMEKEYN